MNQSKSFYTIRRQMRMILVMFVYKFEINNEKVSTKQIFEENDLELFFDYKFLFKNQAQKIYQEQMQIFQFIENHYDKIQLIIKQFIREDWTWSRINPLIRSLLICACVELRKLDLGIVTNEYVEMAKDFLPDTDDYKFINIVIESIEKFYYEKKIKKSN